MGRRDSQPLDVDNSELSPISPDLRVTEDAPCSAWRERAKGWALAVL